MSRRINIFQSPLNTSIEYCLYLIIFLIPIGGKILIYSIIPFFLMVIFAAIRSKKGIELNYGGVFLILFFLLHLLSLLYTENTSSGLYEVEKKLSFLLFPLSFTFITKTIRIDRKKIFLSYLSSLVIVSIVNLINAFLSYLSSSDTSVFYYSNFSWFLHATYYSMYISFSFPIIYELAKDANWKWKIIYLVISIFLFGIVYLLSSKAGLFISSLIIFVLLLRIKNKWIRILSGGLVIILILVVFSNPRFKTLRFFVTHPDYYLKKETQESSSVRIITWESSLELINENILTGVGVGDVRNNLLSKYKSKGFLGAYNKSLNSHNQFLETGAELGVFGMLLLLLLLIFPLIRGIRSKDFILVSFIIIIAINFLFESMLKTQAGVVFFAIIYCILIYDKKELQDENTNRDRG